MDGPFEGAAVVLDSLFLNRAKGWGQVVLGRRAGMSSENPILFKARVMREFRTLLHEEGFVELMTPVVRRHCGGGLTPRVRLEDGRYLRESSAFALRYNLRLAEKIFEFGPCFRQDVLDATHLPEFTMLDLYWGGASIQDAVSLAERLVQLFYHGPIERLSVAGLIRDKLGIDLITDELGEQRLLQYLSMTSSSLGSSFLKLFDRFVREEIEPLSKGCCLIASDFPSVAEARAKKTEGTLCIADRVEFQIDGVEVIHAYADEPDPSALLARAEWSGSLEPEDRVMADLLEKELVPSESAGFGVGLERFCQVCLLDSDISDFMASKLFSIPGHAS
jgi:lysyl-tRNA synthetase class 2